MYGLIMDYQADSVPAIVKRAEEVFRREGGCVLPGLPDRQIHRTTFRQMIRRAKQFAVALKQLGELRRASELQPSGGTTHSTWKPIWQFLRSESGAAYPESSPSP